jgi:site-specific recombinase XerD
VTTFRLKYIKAYTDRHGRRRHYYRRPGCAAIPIPGEPSSREFREAYEAAQEGATRRTIGERAWPDKSFGALISRYLQTPAYTGLNEQTRRTYRNDLERFRRERGAMSVAGLELRHITAMLDALGGKSEKSLRRILSLLLKYAHAIGWRRDNPMLGLRRKRQAYKGFRPWEPEDVAMFEAKWPAGSRERLALYLLLCTIQRRGDAVDMGRQHLKDGKIKVTQKKTGTTLWLPIHPNLKAEIALVPRTQLTFIETQYGAAFKPASFTNWFSEKAQEAGCPKGCTPHGLRKAGLAFMAEAGATPKELMAWSGHKNLAEVTLYTESADQRRLAEQAMEKLEMRTKSSNPQRAVRQT